MRLADIDGIGRTRFGVFPATTIPELIREATSRALEDAGADISGIDRVFISNFLGGALHNQLHAASIFASVFPGFRGKEAFRVESACASGGAAIAAALRSIRDGERVLVVGAEKLNGPDPRQVAYAIAAASDVEKDQKEGLIFPAAYAMVAQQHMLRHGTTAGDLANVSMKNHRNANKNPLAHFFRKEVTLEQIASSPMVSSPLRLFDCSPLSDGAAAIVISRKGSAEGGKLYFSASALATDAISLCEREDLTSFPAARTASRLAFAQAKLAPSDIGVFQVHDCFTIAELVAMEDIGICGPGRAAELVRAGETQIGGRVPVNTDGGLKADGHPIGATGIAQICELALQLRGDAGARQAGKPKHALAHNVGGVGGTCAVHILSGGAFS